MLPAPPKPWTHLTKPLRAHSRTLPSPCKGRPHENPSDPVLNPSQASQKQLKAAGCGQCLPAHHHSYRHPALTACVPPALKKAQHTSHNPSEPIPNPPQASQTQHTTATCRRCLPASHHSSYKTQSHVRGSEHCSNMPRKHSSCAAQHCQMYVLHSNPQLHAGCGMGAVVSMHLCLHRNCSNCQLVLFSKTASNLRANALLYKRRTTEKCSVLLTKLELTKTGHRPSPGAWRKLAALAVSVPSMVCTNLV